MNEARKVDEWCTHPVRRTDAFFDGQGNAIENIEVCSDCHVVIGKFSRALDLPYREEIDD
jgi:hypothetical protein